MIRSYIIEGIDRLGKSTLIDNIRNELGYFEVIHFGKPQVLTYNQKIVDRFKAEAADPSKYISEADIPDIYKIYQYDSFDNALRILKSDARLIFDRAHIGEAVYAPIYRNYSGSYVFDLERSHNAQDMRHVKLILLTENFEVSKHFVDDGESLDVTKRKEEQQLFIDAFNQSVFPNKKIVSVTDERTGEFRSALDILQDVI
jgi:thymidylate kinase